MNAAKNNQSAQICALLEGAIQFLKYLMSRWCGNLIYAWSLVGRQEAACILNTNINNIPTTNNHLESFNSHFKETYIKQFQRGGSLLRVDTLCVCLVLYITPNLIRKRILQQQLENELSQRKNQYSSDDQKLNYQTIKENYYRYAYFEADEVRDCSAKRIFASGGIDKFNFVDNELLVWVKSETHMDLIYTVCVYPAEKATCQCLDFLTRGNACKHLRAAILCINWMRQQPGNFHLPEIKLLTREEIQYFEEKILIGKCSFIYLYLNWLIYKHYYILQMIMIMNQ